MNENPGYFGSAVIGEEAAEREKELVESGKLLFGPAVLGTEKVSSGEKLPGRPKTVAARTEDEVEDLDPDELAEKWEGQRQAGAKAAADRRRTLKAEEAKKAAEERKKNGEIPKDTQSYMVGIRGLRTALLGDKKKELGGNPMLVDEFMKAELARPDGIRKTAVTILLEAEKRRVPEPRAEVLATLAEWATEAG